MDKFLKEITTEYSDDPVHADPKSLCHRNFRINEISLCRKPEAFLHLVEKKDAGFYDQVQRFEA